MVVLHDRGGLTGERELAEKKFCGFSSLYYVGDEMTPALYVVSYMSNRKPL